MTLKKGLKIRKAQSSVEYLVLFAIIATLTLLSVTRLLPALRETLGQNEKGEVVSGGFFDKALKAMK